MTRREPAGGTGKKYHPPSEEKLPPRAYKQIKDGQPAAGLGEFLRAMVRESGITLDTIANRGKIAKNTFTTTMDGRAKPRASVDKWLAAFTHPDVGGVCTDEQRAEIDRLFLEGQENKKLLAAAAKAARKPTEKLPEKPPEVSPASDVWLPRPRKQYKPKFTTVDIELPTRTPGAHIDPVHHTFLDERAVTARLAIERVERERNADLPSTTLARQLRASLAMAGRQAVRSKPIKAVCVIPAAASGGDGAIAMPVRCILTEAEAAEHVGKPTTSRHSSWVRELPEWWVLPAKASQFYETMLRRPPLPRRRPAPQKEAASTADAGRTMELPLVRSSTPLQVPHIRSARPTSGTGPAMSHRAATRYARATRRLTSSAAARWPWLALAPQRPGADWTAITQGSSWHRWTRRRFHYRWTSEPPLAVTLTLIAVVVLVVLGSVYVLAAQFGPPWMPALP